MTHDILQSDIELAVRLVGEQCPDDEIILALTHRGVDQAKAAQLVDDLRKGRRPTPLSAIPLGFAPERRSRPKEASPGNESARSSSTPRAKSHNRPPAPSTGPGRKRPAVFRLAVAVFICLVIIAGSVILIQRYKAATNVPEEPKPKAAMPKAGQAPRAAPATAAVPDTNASSPSLVLDLQPDGLHLGGSLVTSHNVLAAVANLLGLPTRTNHLGRADTVLYAYDRQGLLIYSRKGGGTNSIVLDCEAIGGTNGTTSPFAGVLKIEDQLVGPGTDSQTLAAIKMLELNHPGAGGSVWGARYGGLDLVFAYLKSPQRLSLIEIDLK